MKVEYSSPPRHSNNFRQREKERRRGGFKGRRVDNERNWERNRKERTGGRFSEQSSRGRVKSRGNRRVGGRRN